MMKKNIVNQNQPINFAGITNDIENYLRFLDGIGCAGFDCSSKSLEIIKEWGQKKTPEPDSIEKIRTDIGDCRRCRLSDSRNHLVFGTGDPHADLVFVGEAPGFDEDRKGEPFVGAAGQLLTKIIHTIHHSRESVYICNIIKCRPPGNRNPLLEEIKTCFPFLERQITAIKPKIICALGTFAAQTLLNTTIPISRLRGRFHDYKGIKLIPTYHPAFILRNPDKKRDVWEDMKIIIQEESK